MTAGVAALAGPERTKTPIESSIATGRLVSIDALRGVAALAVTVFHAADKQPFIESPTFLGRASAAVLFWGQLGVYLFFVISGFCIHLRWAQDKAEGREPRIDFFAFWRRRFKRLYPTYVIAMVFYLVGAYLVGTLTTSAFLLADIGLHLLMLHNIMPITTFSLNGVFWTLAVEEQLYLLYFLLLRLRSRFGWKKTIIVTLAARCAWLALGMFMHRVLQIDITVTEAAATLWFCWALGAISVEAHYGLIVLPRWCYSWLSAIALLAASVTVGEYFYTGPTTGFSHHGAGLVTQPLWSLTFFVVVNCLVRLEGKLAQSRGIALVLARLGLISYSLYLTHEIVFLQMLGPYAARLGWTAQHKAFIALVAFTPVAIVFATIFFFLFERPFMSHSNTTAQRTRGLAVARSN